MCCARAKNIQLPEQPGHVSVLLRETLECLNPRPGEHFLDGTFGGGGHTRALLEAADNVSVTALDCDPAAEDRAETFHQSHGGRFAFYGVNFAELVTLPELSLDGALFDLGVSSYQLDEADRGFSFREDAPADMRLNPDAGISAADFLETASEADLVRAIRDYGEEKRWRKVVSAIQTARGSGKLQRTKPLAELISEVLPQNPRKPSRIHPATLSFQGIRIAVNAELESLEQVLPEAFRRLKPGGRLAVISFHSLEDRIVKRFFQRMAGRPEGRHDNRPQDEREVLAKLISRRPITPTDEETQQNPRARSAKLRALTKL